MSALFTSRIPLVNAINILNKYGQWAGIRYLRNTGVPLSETLGAVKILNRYKRKIVK